jgi:hypothetical protein
MKLASATRVLAFWPVPGDGARSVEVTAITPDGMATPLLWIKQWHPQWRSPFYLHAPVALPQGTRLLMTTYFDTDQAAAPMRPLVWIATAPPSRQDAARQK